jgi:hypothetical protein
MGAIVINNNNSVVFGGVLWCYVVKRPTDTVRVVLTYGPTSPRLRADLSSLMVRCLYLQTIFGGNRLLFYNIAQYLYVYNYLFKRQLLSLMNYLLNDNITCDL